MAQPLSSTERYLMETLQYLGSSLSLLFCSFSVATLWRRVFSDSAIRPSRYLDKVVLVLLIFDFFHAIVMANGPTSMQFSPACKPVAFFRVLNDTVLIELHCLMAMYGLLSLKYQIEKLERYFRTTVIVTICVAIGFASLMYFQDYLGPAVIMCWIRQEDKMLQFYFFYIPMVIAWLLMITISLRVVSTAPRAFHGRLQDPIMRLRQQVILLTACFLIVWISPLISRIMTVVPGVLAPGWLVIMHAFSITLLGFADCIVYDQTRSIFLSCFRKQNSSNVDMSISPNQNSNNRQTSSRYRVAPSGGINPIGSGDIRIFASTFNVGSTGIELLDDLDLWIPTGDLYDVYAIAVQECLIPDQLCKAIHFYLGPSFYTSYTESIGSGSTSLGFHGFIQLMVFVRTSLVQTKACLRIMSTPRQVVKGRDLLVAKAPNKGAVAISLFLLDTTICFICCHLSADSHQRSGLSHRVRQVRDILDKVGNLETGFDAHLVHDHCVMLGDMNFRIAQADAREVLNLIADGARFEETLEGRTWMKERYEALVNPYHIREAQSPSRNAWTEEECKEASSRSSSMLSDSNPASFAVPSGFSPNPFFGSLIQKDELTQLRQRGDIFCGFNEMDIRFPPTYRLKKLPPFSMSDTLAGYIEEPLNVLEEGFRLWPRISLAFTNKHELEDIYTVRVWNNKLGTLSTRIPSYTDRVLYHSNPDKAERLYGEKYEACPTLTLSDHLPVSLSLLLRIRPPSSSQLPFYFHSEESRERVESMDLEVSFTIMDIDCVLYRARSTYDVAASTSMTGSDESLNPPSLHQSLSDVLVRQQVASTDGEEMPPKPPFIPRKAISGTYPRERSYVNSSISMQGGSETLPTIHSVNVLFFMANENVLTAIERHKISRMASALTISHPEDDMSSSGFSKVLWRHARAQGIEVKSTVLGKVLMHNIHVLIRLVDPVGRDIGQGVLNLTPEGQLINSSTTVDKSSTGESSKQEEEFSKQAEAADIVSSSVSPDNKTSIVLTSGGLHTGYFTCRIKDFRVIRAERQRDALCAGD